MEYLLILFFIFRLHSTPERWTHWKIICFRISPISRHDSNFLASDCEWRMMSAFQPLFDLGILILRPTIGSCFLPICGHSRDFPISTKKDKGVSLRICKREEFLVYNRQRNKLSGLKIWQGIRIWAPIETTAIEKPAFCSLAVRLLAEAKRATKCLII